MRLACLILCVGLAAAIVCPPFTVSDGGGRCVLCDCDGVCYDTTRLKHWPADGSCDTNAPNLACWAFEHDGGDCDAPKAMEADVQMAENTFRGTGVAVDASSHGS
jgi:hypothetical protein